MSLEFGWKHLLLALLVLTTAALAVGGASAQAPVDAPAGYRAAEVGFVTNLGQWNGAARYLIKNGGLEVWLTEDGVVYHATDTST